MTVTLSPDTPPHNPDDSPAQRRRRLVGLLLGTELSTRVYGPAPEGA